MKLAIVGAGWAGLAAAVQAVSAGHQVTVFEASHILGGRARAVPGELPNGTPVTLDNGQHILIGAYSDTLRLLQQVGIDAGKALLRLPMTLVFADGGGLRLPDLPAPLDLMTGIATARGWSRADKWSLLREAACWQWRGFDCDARLTVAQLCQRLSPRIKAELIEPLCVSALNKAAAQASAQVFLRVLKDALFGPRGGSNMLLPRVNLSELFPTAAARWLADQGAQLHMAARVESVVPHGSRWQLMDEGFDAVILATTAADSIRLLEPGSQLAPAGASTVRDWIGVSRGLQFDAICTVYAWAENASLTRPMLALRSSAGPDSAAPAQFAFDRGQLGGPPGLLAFVVSASQGERSALQAQVLAQARKQLGLQLEAVQTIVERRATFACTPGLLRPSQQIAAGLLACGDYVAGPYPATLEGAVRSAVAAVEQATLKVCSAAADGTTHKEHCR